MRYLNNYNNFNKLNENLTYDEVKKICEQYNITNWTLNDNGLVDVNGFVYLSYQNLSRLPLKFGRVSGGFYCENNKLTTLDGSPISVGVSRRWSVQIRQGLPYIKKHTL